MDGLRIGDGIRVKGELVLSERKGPKSPKFGKAGQNWEKPHENNIYKHLAFRDLISGTESCLRGFRNLFNII
jgi:hypothetical protein